MYLIVTIWLQEICGLYDEFKKAVEFFNDVTRIEKDNKIPAADVTISVHTNLISKILDWFELDMSIITRTTMPVPYCLMRSNAHENQH